MGDKAVSVAPGDGKRRHNAYFGASWDLNNDGYADLAVTNLGSNTDPYSSTTGRQTSAPAVNYTTGTGAGAAPTSVAMADLDDDGNRDLVVTNQGQNSVSTLFGDGTGAVGAPTNFAVGASPAAVASADLNNDGFRDIVTANLGANTVSQLINNGSGSFGTATSYPAGSSPIGLVVADFDSDGNRDLAVVNSASNNFSFLRGNGPTVTVSPTSLTFASQAQGTTSVPQTTTVSNSASGNPLKVSSLKIVGSNKDDFTVTSSETCTGTTVPSPGTCDVPVRFSLPQPSVPGPRRCRSGSTGPGHR